ncbi:MAG: glycosyltransferase family 2 protein [Magnetococcus sp. DMHC-1]|nr:glycosyltransferase family 2 protein [Magnetococcales bacterium]
MIRYSLVIPCYNEAANLPLLIDRCQKHLTRPDLEVILVDNGSTDDSPNLLQRLPGDGGLIRSIRVPVNQGYGFGILSGLRAAKGEILAWTHADLQTDPADILRALDLYAREANPERLFVKGRRSGRPWGDVVFTLGMSLFETLLLRHLFWDINAQPTLFSRAHFQTWVDPPHDFSLDLYAYHQARTAGLQIRRFPVIFGKRAHGISHWNINWRSKVKFIKRTVAFSLQLRQRIRVSQTVPR